LKGVFHFLKIIIITGDPLGVRGPGKLPPFTPLNPALSAGAFTIQRESPLDSGVTDGEARVRAAPPGKLNVKNGNP